MNYFAIIIIVSLLVLGCNASKSVDPIKNNQTLSDTLRIANENIDYEIIIIEPGFNAWLVTQPSKGHYGLPYLEARNRIYVAEFNRRVQDPMHSLSLYPQEINYDFKLKYGLEVNYLLYNYFKYFEITYKQKLR